MAVNLEDLPDRYKTQIMQKVQAQSKKRSAPSPNRPATNPLQVSILKNTKPPTQRKYNNEPTQRLTDSGAVINFDSQKEAKRYDTLMLYLKAGEIKDLKLQHDFTLQEAFTDSNGNRVMAIRYKADFTYKEKITDRSQPRPATVYDEPGWRFVVEDVKSRPTQTDIYRLKKKLMKDKFGIDVVEV